MGILQSDPPPHIEIVKQSFMEGIIRFRRFGALILLIITSWILLVTIQQRASNWEVTNFPVYDTIRQCEGTWKPNVNPDSRSAEDCNGELVVYNPFMQESAQCEGQDALVFGYLSKVRSDVTYIPNQQYFYFGSPFSRFQRIDFNNNSRADDPTSDFVGQPTNRPNTRPTGVQDWGPWRIEDGCNPDRRYDSWFSTVKHKSIHPFWNLTTILGPFPLPPLPNNQSQR